MAPRTHELTSSAATTSGGLHLRQMVRGAIVWDASYKPFGEVETSTGAPINLRFPGQWLSSESNLNQNWMRSLN